MPSNPKPSAPKPTPPARQESDRPPATPAAVPDRESVVRPLAALVPHPKQAELFGSVTNADIAALAADICKRGLQDPVEITPADTIIAGHSRVRAARALGWTEVLCVVRHDLAAAGPAAEFAHFVGSNTERRHMGRLARARARCAAAVLEAEAGRPVDHIFCGREKLKAAVAKQFQMSDRNLNRLLAVLRAPRPVQDAYDRGEVTLVAAAQAAGRPAGPRAAGAGAAGAGGPSLAQAMAAHAAGATGAGVAGFRSYQRLTRALAAYLSQVEQGVGGLPPRDLTKHAQLFDRAARLFGDLAARGGACAAAAGPDRTGHRVRRPRPRRPDDRAGGAWPRNQLPGHAGPPPPPGTCPVK